MVVGALRRKRVVVGPLGGGSPNHIRVTIGTPPENERFIEALKAVLQSVSHLRSY
jgi:histidinol-phosphate aminotransferase